MAITTLSWRRSHLDIDDIRRYYLGFDIHVVNPVETTIVTVLRHASTTRWLSGQRPFK